MTPRRSPSHPRHVVAAGVTAPDLTRLSCPWVPRGDAQGAVTPGAAPSPRPQGAANPVGAMGSAWGCWAGTPRPGSPPVSIPTQFFAHKHGVIHFEVLLLLTGLIEELVITSP